MASLDHLATSRYGQLVPTLSAALSSRIFGGYLVSHPITARQIWMERSLVPSSLDAPSHWLLIKGDYAELLVHPETEVLLARRDGGSESCISSQVMPGNTLMRRAAFPEHPMRFDRYALTADERAIISSSRQPMANEIPLTESVGWWLGATTGNGCFKGKKNPQAVVLSDPVPGVRSYWAQCLAEFFSSGAEISSSEYSSIDERGIESFEQSFCNSGFAKFWLEKIGRKSPEREIWSMIFHANRKCALGYAAGIIDTDGSIRDCDMNACGVTVTSRSRKLIVGLFVLFSSLGFDPYLRESHGDPVLPGGKRSKPDYWLEIRRPAFVAGPRLNFIKDYKRARAFKLYERCDEILASARQPTSDGVGDDMIVREIIPIDKLSGSVMRCRDNTWIRTVSGFFVRDTFSSP